MVDLNARYYGPLAQLQAHFPDGAPFLIHHDQFGVEGDIYFAAGAVV